jgi:surface protein
MNQMFNCCNNLKSLDLSNWNIHNASDMYSMFYDCYQLEYIDVSNWDMSNVEDVYGMFANCKSLKSLDLSSWDFKIKGDKYKINSMFKGCESLNSLDVSTFDLSNFVNAPNIYEEDYEDTLDLFDGCYNLTNIIFGPGWGKSNDDYINLILFECGKNKGYKLSDKTYESMLTMYDRKKAGLSPMEITFNKKHNIPDDWKEKMEERGYEITIFKHY